MFICKTSIQEKPEAYDILAKEFKYIPSYEEICRDDKASFFVAYDKSYSRILGAALVRQLSHGLNYLNFLIVIKSYRKKGIARAIVDDIAAFGRIIVDFEESKIELVKFYSSLGFNRMPDLDFRAYGADFKVFYRSSYSNQFKQEDSNVFRSYIQSVTESQRSDNKAVDAILKERDSDYGPFAVEAEVYYRLMSIMESSSNWKNLDSAAKLGLQMIVFKLTRCINGKHITKDTMLDIIGYATLVLEQSGSVE